MSIIRIAKFNTELNVEDSHQVKAYLLGVSAPPTIGIASLPLIIVNKQQYQTCYVNFFFIF